MKEVVGQRSDDEAGNVVLCATRAVAREIWRPSIEVILHKGCF